MTQLEIVDSLKKEATVNPVANAVFHVFATRERARSVLTLQALQRRMKREQFTYPVSKYAELLKLMSSLGLGKLDIDPKGRIRSLKEIKASLQSIGMAACTDSKELKSNKQRARFITMPVRPPKQSPIQAVAEYIKKDIGVVAYINGKALTFQIPKELDPKDVMDLIQLFRDGKSD